MPTRSRTWTASLMRSVHISRLALKEPHPILFAIFDRANDLTSTITSISSVVLAGEGIWHHFPAGPVAHHNAPAHQENHTGWRERSLLTSFHPCPHSLSKSLASFFLPWASRFHFSTICNWPVAPLLLFTDMYSLLLYVRCVPWTHLMSQCCRYGH